VAEVPGAAAEEANAIYARLIELDPLRAGFYRDAMEGKAVVVVSALGRN
jgi:geranylgeranyl transferase type-2 subunit alpha